MFRAHYLMRAVALGLLSTLAGCAVGEAAAASYGLDYRGEFRPDDSHVLARIRVSQKEGQLRSLDFDAPEPRYSAFSGDGDIDRDDDRVIWQVPETGGEIQFEVLVDHKRNGAYDARLTADWAIVRLDDVFPEMRSRTRADAHSRAKLHLTGPKGWSFETPYGPIRSEAVTVETHGRRLDRPLGWLAAGDLGVRRTVIGDRHIAIAGPKNAGFRRLDVLTFLRWTMPTLLEVTPTFPDHLLIVGGTPDMWRGGLSGPGSLYMHPSRPLVSGNATSTLLHELVHVATENPPQDGDDWISEGIAEYYSVTILRRTDGISEKRYAQTLAFLQNWSDREDGHLADPSTGADTARAVLLFQQLAEDLDAAGKSLDAVAADLLDGEISRERLADLLEKALGEPSRTLADALAAPTEGG